MATMNPDISKVLKNTPVGTKLSDAFAGLETVKSSVSSGASATQVQKDLKALEKKLNSFATHLGKFQI
jgi:hypothetical protein